MSMSRGADMLLKLIERVKNHRRQTRIIGGGLEGKYS